MLPGGRRSAHAQEPLLQSLQGGRYHFKQDPENSHGFSHPPPRVARLFDLPKPCSNNCWGAPPAHWLLLPESFACLAFYWSSGKGAGRGRSAGGVAESDALGPGKLHFPSCLQALPCTQANLFARLLPFGFYFPPPLFFVVEIIVTFG